MSRPTNNGSLIPAQLRPSSLAQNKYYNATLKRWNIFVLTMETKGVFSIWNHHKCLNSLSASLLLNIFLSFEVGIAHAIANFKWKENTSSLKN